MSVLNDFLKEHRRTDPLKIYCVGDTMVDEYYKVSVNRISPEFPMSVMKSTDQNCIRKPGGVANVVYQMKHFNTNIKLFGFVDDLMNEVLYQNGIGESESQIFIGSGGGSVPIKRRFLDGNVQITRWDVEGENCSLKNRGEFSLDTCQQSVFDKLTVASKPDVVIFSDYHKGLFTGKDICWASGFKDVVTVVDPKNAPIDKWQGCTVFKPNKKEAKKLTGLSKWKDQAKRLQKDLGCESVVITHGGDGVFGISKGKFFEYVPDRFVDVESVIGAGDCFSAIFSMAMGYGFSAEESSAIAWQAGALYVQNKMNRPIVPAELGDGIVKPEDLIKRDFKLVFTNGCFDILHSGHLQMLQFAKNKGDKLVVAVNSDEGVKKLKGEKRPIKSLVERMRLLAALECVDFVVPFDEKTPLEIIKEISPDVLVKGSEYETDNIVGADVVKEVYRAPMIEGLSTTSIISKLV